MVEDPKKIKLQKYRYYYDRENNLVKVVSDLLDSVHMFAVMVHPKDPFIGNVYFVHPDGTADPMVEDAVDLVEDRTCPVCDGKGMRLIRMGQDVAERRKCATCAARGYRI